MKVNGQLEVAQLEQIASAAPTPAPTGRIYLNITNPSNAIPTYYNGSAWVQVATAQTAAPVSQNSGTACTVNWATGLIQTVVLTGNATISFSNPTPGANHTLIVQQATTGTSLYQYALNMTDQDTKRIFPYQPVGVLPFRSETSYTWYYALGIKAAQTTAPNPPPVMTTNIPPVPSGVDFSPQLDYLTLGTSTTPFSKAYGLVKTDIAYQNPFFPAPVAATAAAASVVSVQYGPDGRAVYFASATTPFIQGFSTNNQGSATTAFTNPATLPAGAAISIGVHPSGNFVAVGHSTTPFMSVYPTDQVAAFGVKLANPGTLPASQVISAQFSPLGDYLAVGVAASPYLQVYPFSYTVSAASALVGVIGVIAANPSVLPGGGPGSERCVAWRPQGDFIAMGTGTSPYLYVVPFNRLTGAFGTALTVPVQPGTIVNSVRWSPDGVYLIVTNNAAPFLSIYDFSASTITTTVGFTNTGPTLSPLNLAVHPSGDYLVYLTTTSPYLFTQPLPTKQRNYVRLY